MMGDIQGKILSKYGIDISKENIFKLYKIDTIEISSQELEEKIQSTRKRWNSSVNGANEKIAQRDRARLEKADKYEAILRNEKLRKEVFNFYKKGPTSRTSEGSASGDSIEFAKEYFKLVATTKKIKKEDVDFFFKYYSSERKKKKAIVEMLIQDLKVTSLGKDGKKVDVDEESDEEVEGKKKDGSSPLIVNLFQEATILKIGKIADKYDEISKNREICQTYPSLNNGLYEFLGINNVSSARQFKNLMVAKSKQAYTVRQEKGAEYVPVVDLFNILQSIADYKDVVDNIEEFKLLLKYPNLTPYMYAFVEMKPDTIKGIMDIANRNYYFTSQTDFINDYFVPIHDNFGINDNRIKSILRKAEQNTKQSEILKKINTKFGGNKNKRKIPFAAEIVYWLLYWPIFICYFIFELFKIVLTNLNRYAVMIPVFLVFLVLTFYELPKFGWDNVFILGKLISKSEWIAYMMAKYPGLETSAQLVLVSLFVIINTLLFNFLPPLVLSIFVYEFSEDINKSFDWIGIERTFKEIFKTIRKRTEDQYFERQKEFLKCNLNKILINIGCLVLLIAVIILIPMGIRTIGESTGYIEKEVQVVDEIDTSHIFNLDLS